jgi:PAS domain S-box-containing protein
MQDVIKKVSREYHASSKLVVITDLKDGAYLDANKAFLNTLELDRSDVIGKRTHEIGFLTPNDHETLLSSIKSRKPLQDREVVVRSKTGAVVIGLLTCQTVRIENKPCLMTIVTDITKRKFRELVSQRLLELEQDVQPNNQGFAQLCARLAYC